MDTSEQQQQTQYPYHQQQPPSSSSYDPSQSYEAYYGYHHHHQHYDPSSYPQQHYHQYYDPSSYPHQHYDYSSTQAYPPPTQIHDPPEQRPPVENPAAAAAMAALSQLSQFTRDMDAAEKAGMAYNPHHYPQHYPMEHGYVSIQPGGSGHGRRGGGPFRGGGRRGGRAGRGRGRGGGRKPDQSAAAPKPAPPVPVLPVGWCDICRVECNSLEILEKHRNGKPHKKTSQRFEEIQKKQKLLAEYQAKSIPDAILPIPVTESTAEVVEAKKVSAEPEIIPNAQVDCATEQNPESKGTNRNRGGGVKRQIMRYGRGGKRLKSFEPVPRRVPERPRVCNLCNVTCDTLAVFDTHIAGKKHVSKIKRCQGPGVVFGPITAYPTTTQGPEPVFYGLKSVEIIQRAPYILRPQEQQVAQGLETNLGKEVAAIDNNTDPQDPANAPLVFESRKPNPSDDALPVAELDILLGDDLKNTVNLQ